MDGKKIKKINNKFKILKNKNVNKIKKNNGILKITSLFGRSIFGSLRWKLVEKCLESLEKCKKKFSKHFCSYLLICLILELIII